MRVRYETRTISIYDVFEKRGWESILGSEALLDLVVAKIRELGYSASYISTSCGDRIWTLTSKDGEVYRVYEQTENLPPDVKQALEKLDNATVVFMANGSVRIIE